MLQRFTWYGTPLLQQCECVSNCLPCGSNGTPVSCYFTANNGSMKDNQREHMCPLHCTPFNAFVHCVIFVLLFLIFWSTDSLTLSLSRFLRVSYACVVDVVSKLSRLKARITASSASFATGLALSSSTSFDSALNLVTPSALHPPYRISSFTDEVYLPFPFPFDFSHRCSFGEIWLSTCRCNFHKRVSQMPH